RIVHTGFGIYLVANYLQSVRVFVRDGVGSIQQAESLASVQFLGDDRRAHHWWLPYFRIGFGSWRALARFDPDPLPRFCAHLCVGWCDYLPNQVAKFQIGRKSPS